jgi:hypothetical protein
MPSMECGSLVPLRLLAAIHPGRNTGHSRVPGPALARPTYGRTPPPDDAGGGVGWEGEVDLEAGV